jgi:hypothetical protein
VIAAHRSVAAHGLTAEPMAIRPGTAIIAQRVRRVVFAGTRCSLSIISVAATPADRETLQQPAPARPAVPFALPVLLKLSAGNLEHRWINELRNGDLDPLLGGYGNTRSGPRRGLRMSADRPQPRPWRQEAGPPEGGASDIGRIVEHAADRGSMPLRRSFPGPAPDLLQSPAHLPQTHAIQTDPRKDEANDVRFLLHHLEACHAALAPGHIAVAERSARQSADRAGARRMAATAPATLQDLGPLVFGDHALNLEKQIVLGRAADGAVQENDLGTGPTELVDQQRLMGVAASKPIRGVDIDAVDLATGNGIPQPLQRRAKQDRTAVAFVQIARS